MLKAVIFDCFGVLVGRGFDETYRSAGGDPYRDRAFISSILGRNNLGIISQAEFQREVVRQLRITDREWQEAIIKAEQPDEELIDFIDKLHAKYKTAILSNANKGVLQRKLGEPCLSACFDAVVVSAEVGMIKPEQEIYTYTAKQLGVKPSECVFVDDLKGYVEAAEAVGMRGIWYRNLKQTKSDLKRLLEIK